MVRCLLVLGAVVQVCAQVDLGRGVVDLGRGPVDLGRGVVDLGRGLRSAGCNK